MLSLLSRSGRVGLIPGKSFDTRAAGIPSEEPPIAAALSAAPRDLAGEDTNMSLGTILLIVLILLLVGALPTWPHSANWGYFPSGGLGIVLVIVLVLVVVGRI